jgi:transposase-like protein
MENQAEAAGRRRRTGEEVSRLVSEFEASGLAAGAFCRRHGLSASTLRRRLQKRRVPDGPAKAEGRLVAVKVQGASRSVPPLAAAALEVVVTGGRRIGVAPGFDAVTFGRLVRALEAL